MAWPSQAARIKHERVLWRAIMNKFWHWRAVFSTRKIIFKYQSNKKIVDYQFWHHGNAHLSPGSILPKNGHGLAAVHFTWNQSWAI